MKKHLVGLIVLLLFLVSQSYALIVHEVIFPYKGYVFRVIGVPRADYDKVKVTKEEFKFIQFTYAGKEYSAKLFNYGAIILTQGDKKFVLGVDFSKHKFRTFTPPRKITIN